MAALMGLDLSVPVEGVAQTALHLVRQHRLHREEEVRELLREQPLSIEADDAEAGQANARPGVPHAMPQEDLAAPPAGAIPAPGPRRARDVGVQAGPEPMPANPSWEEMESGLMEARALDYSARQRIAETFKASNRYMGTCAWPHASAAYRQRLIAAKREEAEFASAWKAERRTRLQRQQEAEEERARVQLECDLEEARDRRRVEEATLQAARTRWEEARRTEEGAAAESVLVEERPQGPQPSPNVAAYPPRPEAPPRG